MVVILQKNSTEPICQETIQKYNQGQELGLPKFTCLPLPVQIDESRFIMSKEEEDKYRHLFQSQTLDESNLLGGKIAVKLFSKSGLPRDELKKVWSLADMNQDNKLNDDEFVIAMHLIVLLSKRGVSLPTSLPEEYFPTLFNASGSAEKNKNTVVLDTLDTLGDLLSGPSRGFQSSDPTIADNNLSKSLSSIMSPSVEMESRGKLLASCSKPSEMIHQILQAQYIQNNRDKESLTLLTNVSDLIQALQKQKLNTIQQLGFDIPELDDSKRLLNQWIQQVEKEVDSLQKEISVQDQGDTNDNMLMDPVLFDDSPNIGLNIAASAEELEKYCQQNSELRNQIDILQKRLTQTKDRTIKVSKSIDYLSHIV